MSGLRLHATATNSFSVGVEVALRAVAARVMSIPTWLRDDDAPEPPARLKTHGQHCQPSVVTEHGKTLERIDAALPAIENFVRTAGPISLADGFAQRPTQAKIGGERRQTCGAFSSD